MKEKNFLIYNEDYRVRIKGGQLWKIPSFKQSGGITQFDRTSQKLSIFLRPDSEFDEMQDSLYNITKSLNPILYFLLWIKQRVPSLLLLVPIALTVIFIGFITVYGDLVINWAFLGENSMTVFGLPMNQAAIVMGAIAVAIIYFFPVIFSGEQESFAKALNERFSNRQQLRKRLATTFRFLKSKKYVTSVEVWNPNLSNGKLDWVEKSLVPALFDAGLEMFYHIRIDERYILENYIHEIVDKELVWNDQPIADDETTNQISIPYEYLENWEKSMLAVYVFSSTASLSHQWLKRKGDESEGFLNDLVSLRLVQILVKRFKERLFSDKDVDRLISPELFASRCLNDYGILSPVLLQDSDVWALDDNIVAMELHRVNREMRFMTSFLQTELTDLTELLDDPVAAVKLNCVMEKSGIYSKDRLNAIRFFVQVTSKSEQYKIFKQYWDLIIRNPKDDTDLNEEIYRIIGVELLLDLTTILERSAMYDHALSALNYLESVFPFRGKMGKAGIKEREGNFREAITEMLEIRDNWEKDKIQLTAGSSVDLNLDIAWAIVSGRLEDFRELGLSACESVNKLLKGKFDAIRDSNRTFRMYNVQANYAEWQGDLEGALKNYNKALQIPEVPQTGLSNLYVNKGIALRQMKHLEESAICIENGVEIKSDIGDDDQLPIALHNLAHTYIEQAFSISDTNDRTGYFMKALRHAQKGLSIQSQTKSLKKRGQLLAERFVSTFELVKMGEKAEADPTTSLKAVQDWLRMQNETGRSATYDCKVVIDELLGCLDEFQGKTIEDAVAWQVPSEMHMDDPNFVRPNQGTHRPVDL